LEVAVAQNDDDKDADVNKAKGRTRRPAQQPQGTAAHAQDADAELAAQNERHRPASPRQPYTRPAPVSGFSPAVYFSIGFALMISLLILVFLTEAPSGLRLATFIVVLALAASCVMQGFMGSMQITTKWLKATGATATFVFVCLFAATMADPGFSGLASLFYQNGRKK
jgi:hypothetical protein